MVRRRPSLSRLAAKRTHPPAFWEKKPDAESSSRSAQQVQLDVFRAKKLQKCRGVEQGLFTRRRTAEAALCVREAAPETPCSLASSSDKKQKFAATARGHLLGRRFSIEFKGRTPRARGRRARSAEGLPDSLIFQ